MTFLARYAWTSLGMTFLLSAMTVQWSILVVGFWHGLIESGSVKALELTVQSLTGGNFAAGAVMISLGAVLGRASPTQLVVMMLLEIVVYGLNEAIGVVSFGAVDMGGSMFVHTFGAFFGVAVAWALGSEAAHCRGAKRTDEASTSKVASTFAMIGTLVLWMFWPSFNGALAAGPQQHRVVINTVLSLCGSCVAAFVLSRLLRGGKFSMEDIQNATLAGGVAIGSSADLVVHPGPATAIGVIAGLLSVTGFAVISPWLSRHAGIDDTCSVLSLHGLPGVMGGIGGAISAAVASTSVYGATIATVFPARAAGRSASEQAWYQAAALGLTLALSVVAGVITGLVMRLPVFGPVLAANGRGAGLYEDERIWDTSELHTGDPDAPYDDDAPAHEHAGAADAHGAAIKLVPTKRHTGAVAPTESETIA